MEDEPANVGVLKNGGVTKERLPVEIKWGAPAEKDLTGCVAEGA